MHSFDMVLPVWLILKKSTFSSMIWVGIFFLVSIAIQSFAQVSLPQNKQLDPATAHVNWVKHYASVTNSGEYFQLNASGGRE